MAHADTDAAAAPGTDDDAIHYTPVSIAVEAAERAERIDGIATLVSPDTLAQLNADMRTAEISARFSQRAFQRYKVTKSLPEHFVDNAERQAATDQNQVVLLDLKLRNTWGDQAPFLDAERRQTLVAELSRGTTTLVRLDFPQALDRDLKNVSVVPLGGGEATTVTAIWPAPSGSVAMPGTAFFALMPSGPGLRPGDRAKVTAEASSALKGVVVPASAIVVYEGASWCYVETATGKFERKAVSLSNPVTDGYLVQDLEAGTKVVARGASVLLSREAEPVFDDDDDDGGAPTAAAKTQDPRQASAGIAKSDPD